MSRICLVSYKVRDIYDARSRHPWKILEDILKEIDYLRKGLPVGSRSFRTSSLLSVAFVILNPVFDFISNSDFNDNCQKLN
jgi:hypothetical protein